MSHNSNRADSSRVDSNHVEKEPGTASYRLTSNDGWVLVSADRRQTGGYRSHPGSVDNKGGYGTNFNRTDIDRSRFKRDDSRADSRPDTRPDMRSEIRSTNGYANRSDNRSDNRTDNRTDGRYTVVKNAWADKDGFKKRFEASNPHYNEFRRDDNARHDTMKSDSHKDSTKSGTSYLSSEDLQKLDRTSVHDDDTDSGDSESLRKQKNDNYKKILCKNINNIGRCIYNNKCLYAHSLEEQNIEPIRSIAYNMIKKKDDLSHVDLSKSKHLYNHLQALSKLCQHCDEGTCTGGYNCKHGACDKIYVICQTDLNKGTCEGACGKIHLTTKGLVPYGVSIVKNMKTKITVPKATVINEEFFKKLSQNIIKTDSESVQKSVKNLSRKVTNDDDSEIDMDEMNHDDDMEYEHDSDIHHNVARTASIDEHIDENRWDTIVSTLDDKVTVKKAKKNHKKNKDDDNDSLCSDDSGKIDCVLNFFPVKSDGLGADTDSFDDFKFDDVSKREEKLTKSIFRIDVMCI